MALTDHARRSVRGGIAWNARALSADLTGVQRYAKSVAARLPSIERVAPRKPLHGPLGHLWEQFILPLRLRGRLLWSPCNSGPLLVRRQVVTVHDAATLDHPEWFRGLFARWYRLLLPRLVRRAAHVITVSEFSRDRLVALTGVAAERVSVVPNGVDDSFRPLGEGERQRVREIYRLPSRYLLVLGSLEPRKNLGALLEAWRRWEGRPADLDLIVAGGTWRSFADTSLDPPTGVRLVGRVPDEDLPGLYSAATALVYPSVYEGFGLPIVEAMACETLVVASEGLPAADPAVVLTMDSRDPDAIVAALQRAIDLDSEEWARRLRAGRQIADNLTWARAATEVDRILWAVAERAH